MSKRLSELYGLDMYTVKGEYVGKVEDVILNLETGGIMSLCLKPLKGALSTDPNEMKRILKEENISYDNVEAVSEIVLVKSKPVREIRVKRTGK
jgi:sporulation protein YlmC with PRC-barrel domain